jgi:ribosomal protein L35
MAAKVKFKPTKGIAKRFKITANKKLKHQHVGKRKLMSGKRGEVRLDARQAAVVRHNRLRLTILELAQER